MEQAALQEVLEQSRQKIEAVSIAVDEIEKVRRITTHV